MDGSVNLEKKIGYGTKDLTADFLPGPEGVGVRGFGLFVGHPVGNILQDSMLFVTSKEPIHERFSNGQYPVTIDEQRYGGKCQEM